MRYGKEADVPPMSEEGMVRALWVCRLRAASVLPGMTGTGAPVTERLRYRRFSGELGWYRDLPRP